MRTSYRPARSSKSSVECAKVLKLAPFPHAAPPSQRCAKGAHLHKFAKIGLDRLCNVGGVRTVDDDRARQVRCSGSEQSVHHHPVVPHQANSDGTPPLELPITVPYSKSTTPPTPTATEARVLTKDLDERDDELAREEHADAHGETSAVCEITKERVGVSELFARTLA